MNKTDVLCVGFSMLDIVMKGIPETALKADSTHAKEFSLSPGGDCVNQAVVMSRLGLKTALVTNFGTDPLGNALGDFLRRDNIDLSHCIREGIEQTGFSVIVVKEDGERSILVGRGSDRTAVAKEDIPDELLDTCRAISIGSLFFLREMDGQPVADLLRTAKEKGLITFADMTVDAHDVGPSGNDMVYPFTDYLMPSLEEAKYVSGETDPEKIADYFLSKGAKNIVIKMGEDGSLIKNREQSILVPVFRVDAVDTTGCGDAFCGGFITGILSGKSLYDSALFASATGAVNALGAGAATAIRDADQILQFMEEHHAA